MRDLLLEIGVEDMPPRYVAVALQQLKENAERYLEDYNLRYEELDVTGTHRRLVLKVSNLEELQRDVEREVRGPSVKVAFTSSGEPTQALRGFLKAHGGDLSQIEIRSTPRGDYVFLKTFIPGRRTEEILPELLERLIRDVKFEESMRWIPGSNFRFIRPIRWILALYGNDVISFYLENLKSDRVTYGHRILSPQPIRVESSDTYEEQLRAAMVIVSHQSRRESIERELQEILTQRNLSYRNEALIDEWVFLAEHPVLFITSFDERYLSLPPELVESVIRGQQKFLPLYRDDKLTCNFVALKDGSPEHIDIAMMGAKRVVTARLFDAKYFLEEDEKRPLDEYVEELKGIIFHRELGTLYDKTFRLQDLVKYILNMMGVTDEETLSNSLRAAYLCKADLVTHTVNEFPDLQGIVGKYLALYHSEPEEAAEAIAEHYMPRTSDDRLPESLIGTALALADRLDTLVGFTSINILPKGTKDMYGVRRALNQSIQIIIGKELRLDLQKLISFTYQLFNHSFKLKLSEEKVRGTLFDAFTSRFEEQLKRTYSVDLIRSVAHILWRDTWLGLKILSFLSDRRHTEEFVNIVKLGVRLKNILRNVSKVELDSYELRDELLRLPEERELVKWLRENGEEFKRGLNLGNLERVYDMLLELSDEVERFFQKVYVMVDDEELRRNRFKILRELDKLLMNLCDFSKISV